MRRTPSAALAVGFGLVLGVCPSNFGQGLQPPAPGADLERISRQMAEAVRHLADDIAAGAGQSPATQYLARDAQELQQSTAEWYGSLRGNTDPYQTRRSFAGIDGAWHRLMGQLSAPGVANPDVQEEIRRVEQADAQLHQALSLNAYPPNFDGAPAAPTGQDEVRRLAYSLAQRGEALAATIQAAYSADPNSAGIVNDAAQVARAVDGFNDSLGNPAVAQQPDYARQAFSQIVQQSNGLGIQLGVTGMPPPVRTAWDAYTSVHNLIRVQLRLLSQTPNGLPDPTVAPAPALVPNAGAGVGIPYNPNPAAQVPQWADQLDRQADELFANFGPTAQTVPEGQVMLGEIERLRNDVRNFRGDAAQGLDPGRLAFEFREVDADWQRLARRVNRIAQGRTGPNIQRIEQIGQTCRQIHDALGMPGYPPTIQQPF